MQNRAIVLAEIMHNIHVSTQNLFAALSALSEFMDDYNDVVMSADKPAQLSAIEITGIATIRCRLDAKIELTKTVADVLADIMSLSITLPDIDSDILEEECTKHIEQLPNYNLLMEELRNGDNPSDYVKSKANQSDEDQLSRLANVFNKLSGKKSEHN